MQKISIMSQEIVTKDNIDRGFEQLKKAGFNGVDFDLYSYVSNGMEEKDISKFIYSQSEEELYFFFDKYKNAAAKNHIAFVQAHAPFPLFYEGKEIVNEFLLKSVEKCMAICKFLDCRYLVVHPIICKPSERYVQTERNYDFFRMLIPAAKKYGIIVCIENLFYNALNLRLLEGPFSDVNEACLFIDNMNEQAGFEAFGFCFDTGHANLLGKDLYCFITALGCRLKAVHLHDNNGINDQHAIPYTAVGRWGGDLLTDWDGVIRALAETGFKGAINFETKITGYPDEIKDIVLKLICETGKYFRKKIGIIRGAHDG